jgi:hypothetical protein
MFEFLAGWVAFALVSGVILFLLWLVLKFCASFGGTTNQISTLFAIVLFGGPFVALGYGWFLLVDFLLQTGFDALKLLVALMVGTLFTFLWVCLELLFLWLWASAFGK